MDLSPLRGYGPGFSEAGMPDFLSRHLHPRPGLPSTGVGILAPSSPPSGLYVLQSEALANVAYRPAYTYLNGLTNGTESWFTQVYVRVGPSGRPSHAFLEQPSGTPEVDAAVLRAVEGGQAERRIGACRGRLTIGYRGASTTDGEPE